MAEITITNSQGLRMRSNASTPYSWDTAHDQTTAGNTTTSNESGNNTVLGVTFSGYGGGTYSIFRVILDFDLSGIPAGSTINSAKLKLYGASVTSPHFSVTLAEADFIVLKGTSGLSDGATFEAADWQNFEGYQSGWDGTDSGVIEYSGEEASSWNDSGYNEITLNSTAISDITSRAGGSTRLGCYLMEFDHDYHDNPDGEDGAAVDSSIDGFKVNFNIAPGSSNPPQLVVDYEPAAAINPRIEVISGTVTLKGGSLTIK